MTADLNFPVKVIVAPTLREADGLAMSSRNAYLTDAQRPSALTLSRSLNTARKMVAEGQRQAAAIIDQAMALIRSHPDTVIDYVKICDPETLEEVTTIDRPVRMALAVKVGRCRLIDNMALVPPGTTESQQGDLK